MVNKMLKMTSEEIKKVVESVYNAAVSAGTKPKIEVWIVQKANMDWNVVFTTPAGDILMKSARKDERRFASCSSAMKAVNSTGLYTASVLCRQG